MSTFNVPVVQIQKIEPIYTPDGTVATSIEVATVFGYQSVVKRGQYHAGDYAVYIPEASIVPDHLIEELGLTGKLAGPNKNRVKAIRLLSVLSQGLLLPTENTSLGEDLAEQLGIIKFTPIVPSHMGGEMLSIYGHTVSYDIENILRYPDILVEGEEVYYVEKAHGTNCCIAYDPRLESDELLSLHTMHGDLHGRAFAYSKGLGDKGFVFKNVSTNSYNIYHKALLDNQQSVSKLAEKYPNHPVHIFGEIFGPGVQDLSYGLPDKTFKVFDIYIGVPGQGKFLNANEKYDLIHSVGFASLPILYKGPFMTNDVPQYRDGLDNINGVHMREGIVITPAIERRNNEIGRVILKSVSPEYLARKNKNATEYQ